MLDIKILNDETELRSFPITQSLLLHSNVKLDLSSLNNYIILFRLIPEKGLVSLVAPYSYTVGYIKDKFSTLDLNFSQEQKDDHYEIKITPRKPLSLDSDYILYITKGLLANSTTVEKIVSKSNSSLKVNTSIPQNRSAASVVIKTTSKLTSNSNILLVSIDGEEYTLDLKQNNTIVNNNVTYTFEDVVYVSGESFLISFQDIAEQSIEDVLFKFSTAGSDTITPLLNQNPSNTISNQDILDFYKSVGSIKESYTSIPKYIAPNIFTVLLPDGYMWDQKQELEVTLRSAFNNYLLNELELTCDDKYDLYIYQEENELTIEVVYNEQDTINVYNDEQEVLPFKLKGGRGR